MKDYFGLLAAVCIVGVTSALTFPHPLKPDKWVNMDVNAMMHDRALVNNEFSCLLGNKDKCNPLIHGLVMANLKEALFFECNRCLWVQKEAYKIAMPILEREYAAKLAQVKRKYAQIYKIPTESH